MKPLYCFYLKLYVKCYEVKSLLQCLFWRLWQGLLYPRLASKPSLCVTEASCSDTQVLRSQECRAMLDSIIF